MPNVAVIGEPLFSRLADGRLKSRIATVFPHFDTIVTLPGIHAQQIEAFVEAMKRKRAAAGLAPMTENEEREIHEDAVALTLEGDFVQIRPDPENMALAFSADQLLQRVASKRQIKFLNVLNADVRETVKRRGECWRITPLPTSRNEMKERILASKIGILGREIYYYNSTTGLRLLTCGELARLAEMNESLLREHLLEIREFSGRTNARSQPEVGFFAAAGFGGRDFAVHDFRALGGEQLRAVHTELSARFRAAVQPEFSEDDLDSTLWRNRMFSALIAETNEVLPEEHLLALSPEFFMQIEWLPGGRIVRGELTFDEVFEETGDAGQPAASPCDQKAHEFLYNLVREYEDLEYVNIGRIVNSLSRRPQRQERRDVYIAVIKRRRRPEEIVNIIRMQKWGVREHLAEGATLPDSMYKSDEYTEYVLDRRFACHHLGMNIPPRLTARKICERHVADCTKPWGGMIWTAYFERAYIRGIATDKTPRQRFCNPEFTRRFARTLGQAAAPNIIVGRCDPDGNVLFDDGDEVVIEDGDQMPAGIIVADQTGTFWEFRKPLAASAPAYADPVNRRTDYLPQADEFARVYLEAFVEQFSAIQEKYRSRRRAFDTLFRNRPYNEDGSFAYRWEQILKRLDATHPRELAEVIQAHIEVPVVGSRK